MSNPTPEILYAGTNKTVVAIDAATGAEIWRRTLPKGGGLVNILIKGDMLYVSSDGYVYGMDRYMGQIIWQNNMKRLWYSPVMLAMPGATEANPAAANAAHAAAQAAAAAAMAG